MILFLGWIYDATKNYEVAFILGGAVTVLSAIILGCIPVIAKHQKEAHTLPTKTGRAGDSKTVVMISWYVDVYHGNFHQFSH